MNRWFCGLCRISFGMVVAGLLFCSTEGLSAATTQPRYYAHDAVEDSHGVVAPWYQGHNGQIDLRVRVAAEFLKRYPWVDRDRSVMAGPHYVFNARVDLGDDGTITVLPANDNMNGNLGQRFKYITESLPRYYRYSGDPIVFSHAKIAADFSVGLLPDGARRRLAAVSDQRSARRQALWSR